MAQLGAKSKYKKYPIGKGYHWASPNYPSLPPTNTWDWSRSGKEAVHVSQGNPFRLLGRTNRRLGGNFWLTKQVVEDEYYLPSRDYSAGSNPQSQNAFHYRGPIIPRRSLGTSNSFPPVKVSSDASLDALGTRAIAMTIPTNPLSGLAVALGELKRDGIPSLLGVQAWKGRTNLAKSAGSEYLNHQFGWVPLVNDLKRFTYSVRNSDELIAQYARNSGKRIKRELTFPVERKVLSSTTQVGNGPLHVTPEPFLLEIYTGTNSSTSQRITTYSEERHVWFSGCYTYYLPPYKPNGDNSKRNRQLANYLYGTRVTPETLWDLTPWSWAADWVGNFGDVLHNVSAFANDGLVMHYGYMMETYIHRCTVINTGFGLRSYPGKRYTVSSTLSTISKKRRVASPYGFGLDPLGFTNRQWAILAALGISRGPRQL